jgi:hypothetical protein
MFSGKQVSKTIARAWPSSVPIFLKFNDTPASPLIRAIVNSTVKATIYPWHKKRNLVTIVVEGLELQYFGEFNMKGREKALPFLSSLARNSTFCVNASSPVLTRYSSNSLFALQCGMTLISPGDESVDRDKYFLDFPHRYPCFGDALKSLGYRMLAYSPGADFSESSWGLILLFHGYPPVRGSRYGLWSDSDITRDIIKNTLPEFAKNYHELGEPFSLIVHFAGPKWPGTVSCQARSELCGNHRIMEAYDCVDQFIEKIYYRMQELGLEKENTEVVIYGDHVMRDTWEEFIDARGPRKIAFLYASQKAQLIEKSVSVYDYIPTIVKALHIVKEPKWPFGHPVDEEGQGFLPTLDDYKDLYC